jgi:uncharacterized protein YdaL
MRTSWIVAALLLMARPAEAAGLTVCVYYDGVNAGDGRLHSIMVENLLGHFREVSVRRLEVGGYKAGGLGACDRAAYMGAVYGTALPAAFLDDAAAYRRPFLWLNYGIWQLEERMGPVAFARRAGLHYVDIRGADAGQLGKIPGFYRYFDYKGKRFTKVAALSKDGSLIAAPEIMLVRSAGARTLAAATHSVSGDVIPYVTERAGFYYVADDPFNFIDPRDRYVIVADLLFDFLGLPPRAAPRAARVGHEDKQTNYDLRLLYKTVDLLKRKRVPFAISLIPKYVAPGRAEAAGVELTDRPAFLKALRYAQDNGGELLLHGYTHDVEGTPGCAALGTGAGYEFWDRCRQTPLAQDSREFARKRVVDAKFLLVKAGLSTVAWVTPHYAASPADYAIFGRYFDRVVQRVCYSLAAPEPGGALSFVSQFFPYTIYKDHYGQFIWPEDLGFVAMPGSDWGLETPGDIAEAAHGMTVVRDGWASFYWHPQLMARRGEAERLSRLIDSVRADGYEFVSLKSLRDRGE